ncbi:hypothetical protein ACQ4PT_064642 [Festuca glaucescens]
MKLKCVDVMLIRVDAMEVCGRNAAVKGFLNPWGLSQLSIQLNVHSSHAPQQNQSRRGSRVCALGRCRGNIGVAMKRTMALLLSVLLLCYGSTLADKSTDDMLSLQDFRKAITHDPNGDLNSWNSSIDHCLWAGITCSHTHLGRVVALNLTGRGFAGNISPSLGNLTFLKAMDLSANSFSGQLPPLNRLHKLQSLVLSNNTLGGIIPDSLTNCSDLRVIDLSRNYLVGQIPQRLDSLSELWFLWLSHNNLTGTIPVSLSNITQLTKLSLSYNKITGVIPYELGNLPNTSQLFLGGNMLSGEIPLSLFNSSSLEKLGMEINSLGKKLPPMMGAAVPSLWWLSLGRNMLEGRIPASLGNASRLEYLDLGYNNFSGQVPSTFDTLSELKSLNLQANHIEATDSKSWGFLFNRTSLQTISLRENQLHGNIPDFIGNISTQLSGIYLDGNQLTGAVPPSIGNLQYLNSLGLGGNHLSGTIEWISRLTKLEGLYMEMNNFTGSIPSSVGNLANLNLLYLENNQFEGVLPPSLQKLTQLSDLDLSCNNLQGNISLLGNLKQLINLNLSSNLFAGEVPSTLGQCQNLATLQMDQNFLIGDIPISFGNLLSLSFLDLSHNNLSGTIPAVLSDLHLSKLDLSYNILQGVVPANGVFLNATVVSLQGNLGLCGGVKDLGMPSCTAITHRPVARHHLIKVLIPIFGFMSLILLVYLLFLAKKTSRKINVPEISFGAYFPKVSYQDLAQATMDFSEFNLVGTGSYGSVYRGKLKEPEIDVAVKVFDLEMRGAERSFLAECEALRSIQHRNLLPIFTACSAIDNRGHVFKALVYEFMPNGSLDTWLHGRGDGKASKLLGLTQRINIAVNLADALDYLHHDCGRPTIHCDLKPSNILLNDDMTALLADFGIARLYLHACSTSTGATNSVGLRGTIGYIPPEYAGGGQASTSGDVYSFGIVLLEMMIGKRPTDPMFKDGLDIVNYVDNNFPDQVLHVVEDHLIEECGDFSETSRESENVVYQIFVSLLQVALSCACSSPNERMDMKQVATKMQEIKMSYLGRKAKK